MILPIMEVTLDLNNPFVAPTWGADITSYVRGWSSRRGSQRELQKIEAGQATLTLDNRDGRFTPMSSTSPYYPNLLPMRRIRIRAIWSSVTYPIFQGFVEQWPASFPNVGDDQVVTVSLVDGFKVLSLAALSGSLSSQLSGARVNGVLDAISWPAGDRTVDTGLSTVPALAANSNVSALAHLQAVEHAEGGRLFITNDGKVRFIQRGTDPTPSFSGRTWSDTPGLMSYQDLTLEFGDELLINDARLTRTGGTEQVSSDAPSITKYRTRSFVESDIQLSTDNAVSDFAQELVAKYKEPVLRVEGLADNAMKHAHWDQLLSRELRDRVLVIKTPKGASTLSQDSYIEGIEHSWAIDEWHTLLRVSPVSGNVGWLLDDTVFSILDSSTILSR